MNKVQNSLLLQFRRVVIKRFINYKVWERKDRGFIDWNNSIQRYLIRVEYLRTKKITKKSVFNLSWIPRMLNHWISFQTCIELVWLVESSIMLFCITFFLRGLYTIVRMEYKHPFRFHVNTYIFFRRSSKVSFEFANKKWCKHLSVNNIKWIFK